MENASHTEPVAGGADLTGQALGDFHVLRKLGQGGMGQVYLAEQLSLKRKVALKLLRADLAANESSLKRFKLEAEAVAKFTHANVVQVYASGEWQGLHYIALEYVEGRNLRDYLARKGPPEALLALSIMRQIASGLQRASELGIIHRDIKPENILLTRKGEVKVADFGLSRCLEGDRPAVNLTQSGVTMGTPLYMAPEQVEGRPVDARTDVYSFGVTCYHMLAGEPPFRGTNAFEVALQHVRAEPPSLAQVRPDLPPELCAVVHKMMAKDPAQRYSTCRELLKDLARLRDGLNGVTGAFALGTSEALGEPPSPTPPAMPAPAPPGPKRRWLRAAFVLSVLLAAGAGAAGGVWRQHTRRVADDELSAEPAVPTGAATVSEVEQLLKKLVDQELDPTNRSRNPIRVAQLCLDVALPYLEQNRLDEAETLFARLELIQDEPVYHTLGQLGLGIVFALKDRWRESNNLFRKLPPWRKATDPERLQIVNELVRSNRQLARWLAEAAYHNHTNLNPQKPADEKDFPPFLRKYHRLGRPEAPPVRPGADRK